MIPPIAERIQSLIKENNKTATHVMITLGLSQNALSEWKSGKAKPSSDAIIKLADYFDVSTDYLLKGYDKNIVLSKEENEWLDLYRELSSDADMYKQECIGFVKGYIARGKSDKTKS